MSDLPKYVRAASIVVGLLYPVMVFVGLEHFSVTACAAVLLVVVALRVVASLFDEGVDLLQVGALAGLGVAIAVWSIWGNDELGLLMVPALINAGLLVVFGASLRSVPIIERFARRFDADLGPEKQSHCREFTLVWCGFFVVNGVVCALLAVAAPRGWWAAYTGGIAYLLMGAMFAIEFLVRRYRFREFSEHLPDRWLRQLLQSRSSNADA